MGIKGKAVRYLIASVPSIVYRSLYVLILLISLLFVHAVPAKADYYDANNYKPAVDTVKIDETNLPIVFIDTRCGDSTTHVIHKDWRIAARMKIINNANGINYGDTIAHPQQTVDYDGWIAIRYRGNSSFTESKKKPFSIKTMETADPEGNKVKVPIMGMPKDNDWVLMAPYSDRSMIRDVLMFQLERPWLDYSPRARHCEVILDGIYYGVYIMAERPRKGKNRLNLDDPGDSGDELTGGYQLQIDRWEQYKFNSKYLAVDQYGNPYNAYNHIYFQYEHPDYDEMVPGHEAQLNYIQDRINLMEDALASDDYTNPDTGYRQFIDVTSFIDYQLAEEFSANVDGYRLSTHIYKRRDSVDPRFKLTIWDFNIALGNANYCDGERTDLWHYQNTWAKATDAFNKIPFWWGKLMDDPIYVKELKSRWAQYRNNNFSIDTINASIDSLVTLLDAKGARERNYAVFPIWGQKLWPVPNYKTVNTWEKEIDYLKSWITERVAWMDEQLEYSDSGNDIFMPSGTINDEIDGYYSLRGERLSGPQRGLIIVKYKDGKSRKIVIQ